MTEKIYKLCLDIVDDKHDELSLEEMNDQADDVYETFMQRILEKTTALLDKEILNEMSPMLDTADDDELLIEIGKNTDINALIDEVFEEIKGEYLD